MSNKKGMLTRKQQWRRASTQPQQQQQQQQSAYYSAAGAGRSTSLLVGERRTASDSSLSLIGSFILFRTRRQWSTEDDLQHMRSSKSTSSNSSSSSSASSIASDSDDRRVNFASTVKVVLIPTSSEYADAGLCPSLWWTPADYALFRRTAQMELEVMLRVKEPMDHNSAMRLLYQPTTSLS